MTSTERRNRKRFPIGTQVRYQPGTGTYGYEDALADGTVGGMIVGYSPTRVRVELQLDLGRTVTRCVDATNIRIARIAE